MTLAFSTDNITPSNKGETTMKHRHLWIVSLVALAALLGAGLSAAFAAPVAAAPVVQEDVDDDEVEITGTIVAISKDEGFFVVKVETEEGTVSYTVNVPEDFDFTTIALYDVVEVEGVVGETDNAIDADEVDNETEDDDEDMDDEEDEDMDDDEDDEDLDDEEEDEDLDNDDLDDEEDDDGDVDDEDDDDLEEDDDEVNFFCANPDYTHPAAGGLAEAYDAEYEQVMAWFCEDEMGIGQIMLALQTARMMDRLSGEETETEGDVDGGDSETDDVADLTDPQTYINRRLAGDGWGQIWNDEGLIGRGRKMARDEETEDEVVPEEDAVPEDEEDDVDEGEAETQDVDQPERPGRSDRPERPEKPEKPEKPDKPEKPETPGRGRSDEAPGQTRKEEGSKPRGRGKGGK
jgi:hypothetical protein